MIDITKLVLTYYPSVTTSLRMAHIKKSPETFVKNAVRLALYAALGVSAFSFFIFSKSMGPLSIFPIVGVFLVAWPAFTFFFLQSPRSKITKREKEIEKEILFAGRYLLVKLESGYSLITTLEDASKTSGNASKFFKEIINDLDSGTPLEVSLENAINYNSSKKLKKILWSIRSTVKTGTDPTSFLRQILKVVSEEQALEIQKYGKKLNAIALFYLIVGCVMPSLGVTLGVIVSSFIGLGEIKPIFLYSILVFLTIVQAIFLVIVRSIRPTVGLMKIWQLNSDLGKSFMFGGLREKIRQHFLIAGIEKVPYTFFGILFWVSLIPTIIVFFLAWPLAKSFFASAILDFLMAFLLWMVVHLFVIIAIFLAGFLYTKILIFNRVSKMEQVLPSFLRLVSENLQGGMIFERALWNSITPDFGVLAYEMRLSSKKVIAGASEEEALRSFTSKYDSTLIKRSFDLIIEGLKSGGKIALILEKIVDSIEEGKRLRDEMAATNLSYVIFISLIVVVVTPGLFTLGFQFLQMMEGVGEKLSQTNIEDAGTTGVTSIFSFSELAISPDTFRSFSIWAVSLISVLSSLMLSLIQRGNILGGIIYVPFVASATLFFYFIFMKAGEAVFGGLSL